MNKTSNNNETATDVYTVLGAGRPKLLDLFCCAGGAGKGYYDAGFDVTTLL